MPAKTIYDPNRWTEEQCREIFGKGSSSVKATLLQRRNPLEYDSLKMAACYRYGLIPEGTLPMHSRLSADELEAHRLKETADDLVLVPASVCHEFGLQIGTKMTNAKLRRLMGKE